MNKKLIPRALGSFVLLIPAVALADPSDGSRTVADNDDMIVHEGPEGPHGGVAEDNDQYGSRDFDADYNANATDEEGVYSPHNAAEGRQVGMRESVFGDNMNKDLYRPDTLIAPGMSATLGGGVSGFTQEEPREFSDIGAGWDARFTVGTRSIIAGEIAYIGTSRDVTALGLDSSAFLQSHGGEVDARLNLLPGMIQPYILAGAGFTYYQLTNEDFNTSSIADSETVAHFPLGVGAALRYEGFVVDARGVYRPTLQGDLFSEDTQMNTWGANLNLGTEF